MGLKKLLSSSQFWGLVFAQDGSTFQFDDAQAGGSRRHSLAALKDLVSGKKDWWEKKASKTGIF